jgi:hypothetical protein
VVCFTIARNLGIRLMNALRRPIMEATVKWATKMDKTNFTRNVTIAEDLVTEHRTVKKRPRMRARGPNGTRLSQMVT